MRNNHVFQSMGIKDHLYNYIPHRCQNNNNYIPHTFSPNWAERFFSVAPTKSIFPSSFLLDPHNGNTHFERKKLSIILSFLPSTFT